MSRENVEIVLRGFDLCEQGRLDETIDAYSPDARLIRDPDSGPARLTGQAFFQGHQSIREYYEDFFESYRDISFEIERVEDLGDEVLVVYTLAAYGRLSGVPVRKRLAIRDRVRDALIEEEILYLDPAQALEAAGLSE
jgi:ketosteroid isomerase-like protein